MGVRGAVVVVEVTGQDVASVAVEGCREWDTLVEDVVEADEVVLRFVFGDGDGFHCGQSGINGIKIQEVASVEAAKAADEASNAKIAE